MRKISTSALESTSGSKNSSSSSSNVLTSDANKPFEFKDLKYFRVDFCEASSTNLEKLEPVKEWLQANV